MACGGQNGAIAGDGAHGSQRIHGLGPRDARHAVHSQRGDAAVAKHADHVVVDRGGGMQKADENRAFPEQLRLVDLEFLVETGLLDLEHDIRPVVERSGVRHNLRPRLFVLLV